ncbi:MAG: hypothetical protein QHG99_04535 [Methanomicrobiales archaeon]|nr:hypothetical protein [Methanomicrobiales archaeon]
MLFEIIAYLTIGILSFIIGLIAAYLLTERYYARKFYIVAGLCEREDSIAPIITELEKES